MPRMKSPRVAVIGAGVGGLTCAALLAHAGRHVTVFEKNERVGGKLNWLEEGGYTWDMGPSLLTMPYVFERLWEKLGRTLADDLTLLPLPVTCRYRWTDGTVIDEDAAFWQRPGCGALPGVRARAVRSERGRLSASSAGGMVAAGELAQPAQLRHLPKIASFQTMDEVVRRFFGHDPHLVQLFDRFATYNGSSPYRTPAAFNIIPYVEAKFGGWYVKGGLYEIARALERICRELGVDFRTGTEVTRSSPTGAHQPDDGRERTGTGSDARSCLQPGCAYRVSALSAATRRRAFAPDRPGRPGHFRVHALSRRRTAIPAALPPQHFLFRRLPAGIPPVVRRPPARRRADDLRRRAFQGRSRPRAGRCENWFVLVNAPALTSSGGWTGPPSRKATATGSSTGSKSVSVSRGCGKAIRVRRHFTPGRFPDALSRARGQPLRVCQPRRPRGVSTSRAPAARHEQLLFRRRLDPSRRRAAAGLPERQCATKSAPCAP